MRTWLKVLGIFFVIAVMMVHHAFLFLFIWPHSRRQSWLAVSLSRYTKIGLWILDVHLTHDFQKSETQNKMIVCNHMSYLDILCLSSCYPTLYVSSVEVKETPFLGWICQLTGCFFTERRRAKRTPNQIGEEIKEIGKILSDGLSITLFPEGTTTNGSSILPFKTVLIEPAVVTKKEVLPISVKYVSIDGERFGPQNCDVVCYYGDMEFMPHLIQLCKARKIEVKISKTIPLKQLTRQELGEKARELIMEKYR
jgi:lyso-ornithine lipid O-acyltransferase